MTEWIECTLDKLGEIVGGATPSTKCEDYYGGSIPWITPKDLSSFKGRYITSGERNITEKGLASCSAQMMPKDAVLFTSRAPIGYVAIASQSVCTNQGFKSIVVNEKADPLFVYYLLKYNKDAIEAMGSGTTFKEVSGKTMRAVKVRIPLDVSYQKRIAAVLDSLDTKIENNERINDNLQKQLYEIYKAWYQDFLCIDNLTLIESPYGKIPQGWHYSMLGDLCKSVSVTHNFNTERLIFLNTGDVEDGMFLHSDYMAVADMPGQAKKTIMQNDILYSEIRPINRHFAYVDFQADNYVVSTKLMVIRATSFDSRRLYHFLTLQDTLEELQMQAESRSGTFPQIRFENISKLPILIADSNTETAFVTLLHAAYNQIEHNNSENKKLSELRNSLLPQLMSGKIDVSRIRL